MALGASTAVGALLGWAVFLTSRLQEVNSDMRDQTEMLTTILATVTEMSSVGHALN